MANSVLLLGAGFSRNWGGWLASEAFEYLLGHPEINSHLRDLLWRHRRKGGFESALAELQSHNGRNTVLPGSPLHRLENAVVSMFTDMNRSFESAQFEFQSPIKFQVTTFLSRFDAIFSLNQDLLLERHYLNENITMRSSGVRKQRWQGYELPGMRRLDPSADPLGRWEPRPAPFSVGTDNQPYFKLHGSSNWTVQDSGRVLVLGGDKSLMIKRYSILAWYQDQLRSYLSRPHTRLMIIGYSFGDHHINEIIRESTKENGLELFVIDPLGVDIIDCNRNAQIYSPDVLAQELWPRIVGSSRRSLREIFGSDTAEYHKMMRFFT